MKDKLENYRPQRKNANKHTPRGMGVLEKSIQADGWIGAITVAADGETFDGSARIEVGVATGFEDAIVVTSDGSKPIIHVRTDIPTADDPRARRLGIAANRVAQLNLDFDIDELLASVADGVDLEGLFRQDELDALLQAAHGQDEADSAASGTGETSARPTLSDRFIVPPFSVLDARQGYWQERKRAWISLGIQSELGRGTDIVPNGSRRDASHDGAYQRGYGKPNNGLLGFSEQARSHYKANATPSGSQRDEASLKDGKTQRGDGRGRPLAATSVSGGPGTLAAEYKDKGENRLTWVAGDRPREELDETSRKDFAAGRKMGGRPPHGAAVTQKADGSLDYRPTNNGEGQSGTSVFDPVLCELAYRWFSPPEGFILDPFAGGSVRGILASKLDRHYVGVDLRREQIEANYEQARRICPDRVPTWVVGDSRNITQIANGVYDLVFSCPPYADLEVYSDDPLDLSTMDYADFLVAYREIVAASVGMLRDDRFACFVVGDIRDKRGFYRNFVSDTIDAFQDAGAKLYNEAILVTSVGSLPIRVGRQFESGRKLGKTHQNVLVFCKGDPKKATEACGPIEVVMPDAASEYGEEL